MSERLCAQLVRALRLECLAGVARAAFAPGRWPRSSVSRRARFGATWRHSRAPAARSPAAGEPDGRTDGRSTNRAGSCLVTTLVVKLPPALAISVAKAADILSLTHEQLALEAVRLLVRSVAPDVSPRRRKRSRRP